MATERHGIFTSEVPTSVLSDNETSTIPVVFGTAPVHLVTNALINVPTLVTSYDAAVEAFGDSEDWESYTLCEVIHAHFKLYKQSKLILVNVLDPAVHKATTAPASAVVSAGVATVEIEGIIKDSTIVKSADGATTYAAGTDYTTGYDLNGHLVVTRKSTGAIPSNATELLIGYDKVNPSAVTSLDIIGGVDPASGKRTGLELLNQVFPRLSVVPGIVAAPGFSQDPVVAAVMAAKAETINGHFRTIVVVDLDVEDIAVHSEAPAWKEENSIVSAQQIAFYPKVTYKGKTYWLSTHALSVTSKLDAANDGIPYISPSNQALIVDGTVYKDGAELFLGNDEASYLNSQGIVTALNFAGWKLWGNRMTVYPDNKDPKDAFIPIRRMFNWIDNEIVLRTWQRIDGPLTKRLIESIADELNVWFNGLQAKGALLGGRIEFRASENSVEDIMNGKFRYHVFVTPPGPAQDIDYLVEYDTSYLSDLLA